MQETIELALLQSEEMCPAEEHEVQQNPGKNELGGWRNREERIG